MPNYSLDIPSDSQELIRRLCALFPQNLVSIRNFVQEVTKVREGLKVLSPPVNPVNILTHFSEVFCAIIYLHSTLQNVFDKFNLPQEVQTLLALQWPDFLLPPNQLSFYAWVLLFTGYQEGAFYPSQHFEYVINSLVKVIENNGGKVLLNHEVKKFLFNDGAVVGVEASDRLTHQTDNFTAETTICNIDPQKAAQMIGKENFSSKILQKLNYDYSPSNYMAYCVVKDLDLRDYGFGKWNTFHTGHQNLNEAFAQMYEHHDYSNPSFAIPPDQILKLLADPSQEEIKRFSAWKANYATTLLHTDNSMYQQYGIQKSSEFDFFQTEQGWGYNAYLNQLCGISSSVQYSLV